MVKANQEIHLVKLRPIFLDPSLTEGEQFVKWDENSPLLTHVTLKVDEKGFYLFWTGKHSKTDFLDISCIRDTRTGRYAKTPKNQYVQDSANFGDPDNLEDKTVTICYGNDFVNVRFINFSCGSKKVANKWCDEILKAAYNLLALSGSVEMFLKKAYTKLLFSVDISGYLPVSAILREFASDKEGMNQVEKALDFTGVLKFIGSKVKIIDPRDFTYELFYQFYYNLTLRFQLEKIFAQICKNKKNHLTPDELVEFLNNVQRDCRLNDELYPCTNKQRALEIITRFEPSTVYGTRGLLSYEGFLRYLTSSECLPVRLDKVDLCNDMTEPVSHYFINSSHNTYLTGHQFNGQSSPEMYRQALLSGCRCVELDFWDGKFVKSPVVVHGYTLVKEISAKEVIDAIAESAFKTSEYPVILSFENHCGKRNQAKIAKYCREAFGDLLLEGPIDGYPLKPGFPLPSPFLLKRKIIIKNKKRLDTPEPAILDDNEEYNLIKEEVPSNLDAEELGCTMGEEGTSCKETEAGAEISALVNYVQPIRFHSFEESEERNKSYEMSSFVETKALAIAKYQRVEFVDYNKRQISRVYPSAARMNSSNFMPHDFWNCGVQMVALNFQTTDVPLQLNSALFEFNNQCGYLLKPDLMRRQDKMFDPLSHSPIDGVVAETVSIQVISGQLLSKGRVGTYVEVEMYGIQADTHLQKFRTKTTPPNGINPLYDEDPFVFPRIIFPDLACIRLAVYEEAGGFIGHRVLPINAISPGYKFICLRNELGQPLCLSSVFVHIIVENYIPDTFSEEILALSNPIRYQNQLNIVTPEQGASASIPGESILTQPMSSSHAPVQSTSSNPLQQTVTEETLFIPPELIYLSLKDVLEAKSTCKKRDQYKKKMKQIRKKLGRRTLSSSPMELQDTDILQMDLKNKEKALALKSFESFWRSAYKEIQKSYNENLQILTKWKDKTEKYIMKSIRTKNKDNMRTLKLLTERQDDQKRLKYEVSGGLIKEGVKDKKKLDESYQLAKDGLEAKYSDIKAMVERYKEECRRDLDCFNNDDGHWKLNDIFNSKRYYEM